MSTAQSIDYGIRSFDLATARDNERVNIRANNLAILDADDAATIRFNDPQNAGIEVRKISSITIPPDDGRESGIERIYLSNPAGSGRLTLLTGFAGASGSTSTPSDDTTDVSDRAAREVGKIRLQDENQTLIKPDNPLTSTRPPATGVSAFSQSIGSSTNLTSQSVPPGYDLVVLADDANGDDVLIDGSFPLQAGSSIDLGVSNADQVTAAPASGTQTIHAITEVR
jgi:hypothetical protein